MALPLGLLLVALIVGLWIKAKRTAPLPHDHKATADRDASAALTPSGTTRRSAKPIRSYFPEENLPQEFVEHFNISSIRSSIGPRLVDGKTRLADYLPSPPRVGIDRIVYEQDEKTTHEFVILARGDFTHDGLEDLQIEHRDSGTRNPVISTFLVTRRSPGGAISFLRADETVYPAGGNGEIYRVDHHSKQAFDRSGEQVDH